MEHEDQSNNSGTGDPDLESVDARLKRHVVDPGKVPFPATNESAKGGANDGLDERWPFDDLDEMPSYVEKYDATAVEGPLALVVPRRRNTATDPHAAGSDSESRIPLYWRDCRRVEPEGLVLTDAEDQVLDLAMFRVLRDRLGAWVDAPGREREVLAALHCAAYRADEPGIGAPVL